MCKLCEPYNDQEELKIYDVCSDVSEIPILPNLIELSISFNDEIKSIPILPNLEKLYCKDCNNLSKLSVLPNLKELTIRYCPKILQIPLLPSLERLNCTGLNIVTLPSEKRLWSVDLKNCRHILPFKMYSQYLMTQNCRWLSLERGFKFDSVREAEKCILPLQRRWRIQKYNRVRKELNRSLGDTGKIVSEFLENPNRNAPLLGN